MIARPILLSSVYGEFLGTRLSPAIILPHLCRDDQRDIYSTKFETQKVSKPIKPF